MKISIVFPVHNEYENLKQLIKEWDDELRKLNSLLSLSSPSLLISDSWFISKLMFNADKYIISYINVLELSRYAQLKIGLSFSNAFFYHLNQLIKKFKNEMKFNTTFL